MWPTKKALFIRRSDEDVSHTVKYKVNPIAKGTVLPAKNALIIRRNEVDVSRNAVEKKTKPMIKGTVLPAGNSLIIGSNDEDVHGTVDKKTKPIAIDVAKRPSVWRFLQRRWFFKSNTLRKSLVEEFIEKWG